MSGGPGVDAAAAGVASASALFRPFAHPKLPLKNRIVMAPMTRYFAPGGIPNEAAAAYYRRRAEGGVGLIVTEGTWIDHPTASNDVNVPNFHGEEALARWAGIAREVHRAGGRIAAQLRHAGLIYQSGETWVPTYVPPTPTASPSGYIMPGHKVGQAAAQELIDELIDAYARGAVAAKERGFDAVEFHAAHGYLIDQFFWGETNRRTDGYGGHARQRARFAAEIVRECRRRVGPDFPLILRFSQWKLHNFLAKGVANTAFRERIAQDTAELAAILTPLVDAGVDVFHCSQRRFWEPEFAGSDLNLAGWTRKLTGLPAITVGSVGLNEEFMDSLQRKVCAHPAGLERLLAMLERDEFDLVAVGRALIADPQWPLKLQRGAAAGELTAFAPAMLRTLE
jgi:2,4-dienoyl-CoA reductase-like NADH-dependent reductase (Old Yellow Enzyme family)